MLNQASTEETESNEISTKANNDEKNESSTNIENPILPTEKTNNDNSSDSEIEAATSMEKYEQSVIDSLEQKKEETTVKESPEKIRKKIKKIKKKLANAKLDGKQKQIQKLEKKLAEEEVKLLLPDAISVDLGKIEDSLDKVDEKMPESNDELMKYWHYKVMHTNFVGDDSIDLTLDDSDNSVFKARNNFIQNHCEPYTQMTQISNNVKFPTALWESLFPHQRTGVQWLTNLWFDKKGGIEGDEMGLGKTAIVCSFLHASVISGILKKPTLILCPLTVCQQWIRELHIWCPQLRAIFLHSNRTNKKDTEEDIINTVDGTTSIIVTNYETLHRLKDTGLLKIIDWGVIICDEGHKIRNYQSEIAHLVKQLTGDFRLAVSGSPIQNSLIELWSIFDFAIPGLLGALDVFTNEFADPIKIGGYANASSFQVFRAYSAAIALRNLIQPYLLRRLKKDINANLPSKMEQIFFVNLTKAQIDAYNYFSNSSLCRAILNGNGDFFAGIDILRKICNHPFLAYDQKYNDDIENSAKLILLHKILPQWKRKGHRALIFSQYKIMLDQVEKLFDILGLSYFRIDGDTASEKRLKIIDRFNNGENFACISTTKVGGIGVNLVGADRVVIVDPDWNPSTDNQALERAWRIGQTKDVSVYRLITIGTIEEKIYKKQIYKQFLSNKILLDPKQKRVFTPETARDLFNLDIQEDQELKEAVDEAQAENIDEDPGDNAPITGDEKEMISTLMENGDIQSMFNHDEMFKKKETPEIKFQKEKAKNIANKSLDRLKKSTNNGVSSDFLSRDSEFSENPASKRLFEEIVEYFHAKKGICKTKNILKRFKDDKDVSKHPELFKQILRGIAVFNKKSHLWHVKSKYK